MAEDVNKVIEGEVEEIVALQQNLVEQETKLMENPEFKSFLELQKTVNAKAAEVWKNVEAQMIENDVKSIKGEWGSLTITERTNYKAVDLDDVPRKFIKKQLDTTKVAAAAKLENELPKGVTSSVTKFLTKRLK